MMERHVFSQKGVYDYSESSDHPYARELHALFLNDSSLVIRKERKTEGLNGGFYYKTLETNIYKVFTNPHGEKYLRAYRVTANGLIFSSDLADLRTDRLLYSSASGGGFHCEEMTKVIEGHLSKLLGFSFTYKPCPKLNHDAWYKDNDWDNTPEVLCYPFLRDADNREFLMALLKEDQAREKKSKVATAINFAWRGGRGLSIAARNSKTQEEFIRHIVYKSAIKTKDDLQCLKDNPHLLRVFSHVDLKMGAKEALDRGYAQLIHDAYEYMNISELYGFRFLLSNLPKGTNVEVLELAAKLANTRTQMVAQAQQVIGGLHDLPILVENHEAYLYNSPLSGIASHLESCLKMIPASDRKEFALSFFDEFKKGYEGSEEGWKALISMKRTRWSDHRRDCFIKVMDVYMKAYSKIYFQNIPMGATSRAAQATIDLFGIDISNDRSLKTGTVTVEELNVAVDYYDFGRGFSAFGGGQEMNLFRLFRINPELSDVWNSSFLGPSHILFKDYLQMKGFGNPLLASDLDKAVKKIAERIDRNLAKLGQEPSPANRMIYVQTSAGERKYKCNWRYYNFGVAVDEVRLYKKAGLRSKRDILLWLDYKKTLPAEMYKELLNDAAYGSEENFSNDNFLSF